MSIMQSTWALPLPPAALPWQATVAPVPHRPGHQNLNLTETGLETSDKPAFPLQSLGLDSPNLGGSPTSHGPPVPPSHPPAWHLCAATCAYDRFWNCEYLQLGGDPKPPELENFVFIPDIYFRDESPQSCFLYS